MAFTVMLALHSDILNSSIHDPTGLSCSPKIRSIKMGRFL